MKLRSYIFILLSSMAFLIISGCSLTIPTRQQSIIDLSYNQLEGGFGFGKNTDEVKRWQTFKATTFPKMTKIEVRIYKREGDINQSDVTVELYAVTYNLPSGPVLATATIPADSLSEINTIVGVNLTYYGLVNGQSYAIVLGQATPDINHYCWETGDTNFQGCYYGKYNEEGQWIDESGEGRGWLKVYVSE